MFKNALAYLTDKGGTPSRLWKVLSNAWDEGLDTLMIVALVIFLTPALLVFGFHMVRNLRNLILFGDKLDEQKDSNA